MRRGLAALLVGAGLAIGAAGAWIPGKALLAQVLLEAAWTRALETGQPAPPWPWADTAPIARLRAPGLDREVVVLSGSSGRTLAFGPGHVTGTAAPGEDDNIVLAGHRDTHFAFLQALRPGEWLELESLAGTRRYRIETTRVVDERDTQWMAASGVAELTLITCYPFDAVRPGGPLRYVVHASAEDLPH